MNAFGKNTELFIKPDLGGKYKHWTHDWHSNKIFTFFEMDYDLRCISFLCIWSHKKVAKWQYQKKISFKEHNFIENADIKHCEKL